MLLIPAIDLKDGQCVCFGQGGEGKAAVVSADPAAVVARWVEAGARRVHIVDHDGMNGSGLVNGDLLQAVTAAHPELIVQVDGGIRDEDTAEAYIGAGADYVVIGTKAINTPHFVRDLCIEFGGHVLVGLNVRSGKVAADGWSKLANHDAVEVARHFERDGVEAIVLTDIERNGRLSGVDAAATAAVAREIAVPVIVCGGLASLTDVRDLCALAADGVMGAVVGRALYEGRLELAEAQKLADSLAT
ncbi:MAG TPA: HisA/HisF-related TIM barrel protein [Gammaproteobacteria bacterium]|nr:HisA/HisF-related TIM barrel protein [Gammaproteobacteria bacterium]